MAAAPTVVTLNDGTDTITIFAEKVSDTVANKNSVRFTKPFMTTPSASFYNLRRIDEMITVTGRIHRTSSSNAGDTTARLAAYRLRSWAKTKDTLTLSWGKSGGSNGSTMVQMTGFMTQLSIDEDKQDAGWDTAANQSHEDGAFTVIFSFAEGTSLRT